MKKKPTKKACIKYATAKEINLEPKYTSKMESIVNTIDDIPLAYAEYLDLTFDWNQKSKTSNGLNNIAIETIKMTQNSLLNVLLVITTKIRIPNIAIKEEKNLIPKTVPISVSSSLGRFTNSLTASPLSPICVAIANKEVIDIAYDKIPKFSGPKYLATKMLTIKAEPIVNIFSPIIQDVLKKYFFSSLPLRIELRYFNLF